MRLQFKSRSLPEARFAPEPIRSGTQVPGRKLTSLALQRGPTPSRQQKSSCLAGGTQPSGIALCLATGGMVNLPLIQTRLREIFGAGRVEISPRGNTIISEGAAWIAHDNARLVLAKNIEVQVARSAFFPVVHAGALMPREMEVHKPPAPVALYCCDPTDGLAKFLMMSPKRTGAVCRSMMTVTASEPFL